ncbi:hypothetical protein KOR42_41610 [Thalassoglobus neptunius]|uniref:Uncharacterized protein n=1 Tax=Thalassoglobus neptunius TaxID=1938619 RepID=A0A5C5WA45_9PLAN|nr:hypothetical protein [Thalassoglobus neptunius]TWT47163.1 hypothetical protein KOR42_41610 [Thalassoglobus neptunius]
MTLILEAIEAETSLDLTPGESPGAKRESSRAIKLKPKRSKRKRKKSKPIEGTESDGLGTWMTLLLTTTQWSALLESAQPHRAGPAIPQIHQAIQGHSADETVLVSMWERSVVDLCSSILNNKRARDSAFDASKALVMQVSKFHAKGNR